MNRGKVLDDLAARGLIADQTSEVGLRDMLSQAGGATLYYGIDPTATSLHLGNLIGVLALRRFQQAGHRPIALVGGATGMVGDPSGRQGERELLSEAALGANVDGIKAQLERLLDFEGTSGAAMVNNYDWSKEIGLLEFLREVGKHITVNQMVAKDSIRSRMESETGISFTEFAYMLLQAHDFWWLNTNYGCALQIGGSDQWGNIVAGIELIRKRSAKAAHGITWPLMTRSDGEKFGKTAKGAIWLDPAQTIPYEFHQYFLRVPDSDAKRLLLQFTFLGASEIDEIMETHNQAPEKRIAQATLADAVTDLVHGPTEMAKAKSAAAILFGNFANKAIDEASLSALRGVVAEAVVDGGLWGEPEPIVKLLVATGICSSNSDARRAIAATSIRINGHLISEDTELADIKCGKVALVQRGKKQRVLAVFE